jgi:hypothetical protein
MYAGVGFPVFRLQRRSSTPPPPGGNFPWQKGSKPTLESVQKHRRAQL